MKTLIIHASDPTTDFLCPIYEDIPNSTVIRNYLGRRQFHDLVLRHDRVIFLGHGTNKELFGPGGFRLTSKYVYLLRDKPCVYIWCNADQFVRRYKLKGFYTGMIISEYIEAMYESVACEYKEIDESNELFTKAIKFGIDKPDMLNCVKAVYGGSPNFNRVIDFNYNNLYDTE
jgi:hypothetical protein